MTITISARRILSRFQDEPPNELSMARRAHGPNTGRSYARYMTLHYARVISFGRSRDGSPEFIALYTPHVRGLCFEGHYVKTRRRADHFNAVLGSLA